MKKLLLILLFVPAFSFAENSVGGKVGMTTTDTNPFMSNDPGGITFSTNTFFVAPLAVSTITASGYISSNLYQAISTSTFISLFDKAIYGTDLVEIGMANAYFPMLIHSTAGSVQFNTKMSPFIMQRSSFSANNNDATNAALNVDAGATLGAGQHDMISFQRSGADPGSLFISDDVDANGYNNFVVYGASTTVGINPDPAFKVVVSSGATNKFGEVLILGHVVTSNTQAASLSSCGGTPSLSTNSDDFSGTITVGTTATGCTLTFARPFANKPTCLVTNQSMSITSAIGYTTSTTALTVSQAIGLSGDLIDYICVGH